jgi:cytochrome c oxidase subunit 2
MAAKLAGVPGCGGPPRCTVSTTVCRTGGRPLVRRSAAAPQEGNPVSPIRSAPRHKRAPGQLRRWLPRAAVLLAIAAVTTGCKSTAFTRMGMLPPVTRQGQVTLHLWQGSWIAAWCVGIVVWGGILWAVIFHRKRGDQLPHQVRYNMPIEILYTVLPFIMVGVIFFFTARDENYITKVPPHPDVVVNVTGFQWSWQFQYPHYKVTTPGGASGVVTEHGAMWNPANRTQNLPLLVIPENETVQFNLTSIDVIHAFWVDEFEFKRDVVPGFPNHFQITATKTGTFIGRCTELCGVYHSRMLFRLKIVTPAEFTQWIAGQQQQQSSSGGAQ